MSVPAGVPFRLVDVFTERPFGGNPLAVVTDAAGLRPDGMQRIAREFNFSETTFVLPPGLPEADFRVRIFTPARELPFAGHPTLGTAFALALDGRVDLGSPETRVTFEEGVGPIPVRIVNEGGRPGFVELTAPPPEFGPPFEDREALAGMLSLDEAELGLAGPAEMSGSARSARAPGSPAGGDGPPALRPAPGVRAEAVPQVVSCGVPFLFVPLRSLDAVRRLRFRVERWQALRAVLPASSVFAFALGGEEPGSTAHGRMFDPGMGIVEDPATGSAAAPLGCLLVRRGLVAAAASGATIRMVVEQGYEMRRPSLLHVEVERRGDNIASVRVGGRCASIGRGTLDPEALA